MPATQDDVIDGHEDELKVVMLPSGGIFYVYDREVGYFETRVRSYMKDNHFKNASDLATLDQILVMELLMWRYGIWASQQRDYWQEPVDESSMVKTMKDTNLEIRRMKESLGIDKVGRDKAKGEHSVADYLENLRVRAKEFGVTREKQLDKALELFNQLNALITLHYNCTPDEQEEQKIQQHHILEWIRDTAIPEYTAIDDHFRKNQQKTWIRDQ